MVGAPLRAESGRIVAVRGGDDVRAVRIVTKVGHTVEGFSRHLCVAGATGNRVVIVFPNAAELGRRIGDVGRGAAYLLIILGVDIVMATAAHVLGVELEQPLHVVGIAVGFIAP